MIVLHINTKEDVVIHKKLLIVEKYLKEGKSIYALIYMEGCGPCKRARPQWALLKSPKINNPFHHNSNIVLVDIDQELLRTHKRAGHLFNMSTVKGFPTVRLIRRGDPPIEYDISKMGSMTVESLIHFMKDHSTRYQEQKPFHLQKHRTKRHHVLEEHRKHRPHVQGGGFKRSRRVRGYKTRKNRRR